MLKWLKRLEQFHAEVLEDSTAELNPTLLLEIYFLVLQITSKLLSQEQSTLWSRAKWIWQQRFPFTNYLQNFAFQTHFSCEDRLEDIQKAEESFFVICFKMEELLLEIANLSSLDVIPTSTQSLLFSRSRVIAKTCQDLVAKTLRIPNFVMAHSNSVGQHINARSFLSQFLQSISQVQLHQTLYQNELRTHLPLWQSFDLSILKYPAMALLALFSFRHRQEYVYPSWYSLMDFLNANVYVPVMGMIHHVFDRPRTSAASLKKNTTTSKLHHEESLSRMLHTMNFTSVAQVSDALELEMQTPFRSALWGNLLPLALLQVQILMKESLSLAGDLNQLLEDNRFNSQLLIVLPSVLFLSQSLSALKQVIRFFLYQDEFALRNQRDQALEPLRFLLWELEVLLIQEDDGPTLFSNVGWVQQQQEEDSEKEEEESPGMTKSRMALGGQIIHLVFQLDQLVQSRHLSAHFVSPQWQQKTRQDIRKLFPREGWSVRARMQLVESLRTHL